MTVVIVTFCLFLLGFTGIGMLSGRAHKATHEDYLVANRDVSPWLVALSAVSTNNSGYMFIGLIGFTWRSGMEAIWITGAWIVGDWLTWRWVQPRVREQSERIGATSVPRLLATDERRNTSRMLSVITGLVTFIFLSTYAAAQLKAGATTLHALFDWPVWIGATLGIAIVVIYCFSGGIRASIWTDAAQSTVMLGAMGLLLFSCVSVAGGPSELMAALEAIDPKLTTVSPNGYGPTLWLYVLGFIFAGIGTIGQPHILVRYMTVDRVESMATVRRIYFTWYIVFSAAAFAVGLYARVIMPDLGAGLEGSALVAASEGALPQLSMKLLAPVAIGVMLAGLFSATMSTADSQLLSCSAAVTQDIAPRWQSSYRATKAATLSVAALALLVALFADEGVFELVLVAWSVLAATLAPILVVRLANAPLSDAVAVLMMAFGVATVLGWRAAALSDVCYEALPGILVPLIFYALQRAVRRPSHRTSV